MFGFDALIDTHLSHESATNTLTHISSDLQMELAFLASKLILKNLSGKIYQQQNALDTSVFIELPL